MTDDDVAMKAVLAALFLIAIFLPRPTEASDPTGFAQEQAAHIESALATARYALVGTAPETRVRAELLLIEADRALATLRAGIERAVIEGRDTTPSSAEWLRAQTFEAQDALAQAEIALWLDNPEFVSSGAYFFRFSKTGQ